MKVVIFQHDHKEGTDVGVYDSFDSAYAGMADVIRRFYWEDTLLAYARGDDEQPPATPPDDNRECVEVYFNWMGEQFEAEWMLIDEREVQTLETIAQRGKS